VNDHDRLAIEQACARLATAFHVHIDAFEHDAVLGLFAEDALWVHPMAGELRGREAMKAYLDSKSTKPAAMHVTSNILIDVIDENHAKGRVYYTFYYDGEGRNPALLTGPMAVGQYRDEYVRTDAGWRFSYREPKNVFMAADFGSVVVRKSDEKAGS
jgi:ketosteroid isomerase-like protein